jgi:hypothetical protein
MGCKNGEDIFHPFMILGVFQSVDMGKEMGMMPVGCLFTGSVGMRNLFMLGIKGVRQVSYILFPDRFEYLIMGHEFVDSDEFAPALAGLVLDQHAVAEKFPADGGAIRVNYAQKSRVLTFPVHKYTSFLRCIFTLVLHFRKFIGKFVGVLRQHVNMKEFIRESIPAEIIMTGNLSLNFDKIPDAHAASSTPVAVELHHGKIQFMFTRIIKIGI